MEDNNKNKPQLVDWDENGDAITPAENNQEFTEKKVIDQDDDNQATNSDASQTIEQERPEPVRELVDWDIDEQESSPSSSQDINNAEDDFEQDLKVDKSETISSKLVDSTNETNDVYSDTDHNIDSTLSESKVSVDKDISSESPDNNIEIPQNNIDGSIQEDKSFDETITPDSDNSLSIDAPENPKIHAGELDSSNEANPDTQKEQEYSWDNIRPSFIDEDQLYMNIHQEVSQMINTSEVMIANNKSTEEMSRVKSLLEEILSSIQTTPSQDEEENTEDVLL